MQVSGSDVFGELVNVYYISSQDCGCVELSSAEGHSQLFLTENRLKILRINSGVVATSLVKVPSQWRVSALGFVLSFLRWKQIMRLNWERNLDHRTWRRLRSLVMAKYSRFLWLVMTSMGATEPSR